MGLSAESYRALLDALPVPGSVHDELPPEAARDARAVLFVALRATEGRQLGTARRLVDRALALQTESGTPSAVVSIVAAMVLYLTRDYDRSLALFSETARRHPRSAKLAYRSAITRAGRLGFADDVRQLIEEAISREPRDLRWRLEALRLSVTGRNYQDARRHAETALKIEPSAAAVWMELAHICRRMNDPTAARRAVKRALREEPHDLFYLLEAGAVGLGIADYPLARESFSTALREHPGDAAALEGRATTALRNAELEEAASIAHRLREALPPRSGTERIAGAVALFSGELDSAREHLLAATRLDPKDAEAWVFLGEAELRSGRFEAAGDALHRAGMCADGFLVSAWILRLLRNIYEGDPDLRFGLGPHRLEEMETALRTIVPGSGPILESGRLDAIREVLEEALRRIGPNRSTALSLPGEQGIGRQPLYVSGPRFDSRKALELVRSAGPKASLAALDKVIAAYPESALPLCHRGELRLWLGDLDGARADLEGSIAQNPQTRWAYIGLTGLDTLAGDNPRALETSAHGIMAMGNTTGAAVHVYRGGAHRRLGQFSEARADLERACELHPSRVGAFFELALLEAAEGHSEAFDALFERLLRQAPGLLSDAARTEGVSFARDPDDELSSADRIRVVERALDLSGGNRSSTCITYRTPEGRLRFVPHYPHRGRGPHDSDDDDRMQAHTLLLRAAGLTGPRRPPPARSGPKPQARPRVRSLSDEDVRHFLERGYVYVRAAFPKTLAEAWIAEANKKLQTEPGRWVRRYGAEEGTLADYDPTVPETWGRGRADLLDDRMVRLAEAAPRLWSAACDLLGGAQRIETEHLSNYLVLAFGDRTDTPQRPKPGDSSWHLDDPSEAVTLDGFRNGLIGLVLLSDLQPDGGNTFIAADSFGKVARLLADHPDGVDFLGRETAMAITRECAEFHQMTGAAGDAILMHPMMLHSSSKNPTRTIRWLSNPMFYLREPMRFDRPDGERSLVEEATRQALEKTAR
ncbi:MAG: tetratricopeptide repeat protein [Myxococcota bacterium]